MKAKYGAMTLDLLMEPGEWTTQTSASSLGGLYVYDRSTLLQAVSTALRNFDQTPTAAHLTQVRAAFTNWLGAKPGRFNQVTGRIKSVRATGAAALNAQLAQLVQLHQERDTAMGRVRTLLDQLNWKTKCLCAELYDPDVDLGQASPYVDILAEESNFSSGWARLVPDPAPVRFWDQKGAEEAQGLQQWPQLSTKARTLLTSRHGGAAWPPWRAGTHVRKGLFCHSAAALAVHAIRQAAAQIEAGCQAWRIRAVDVIHQKPIGTGPMTHWWVGINRPDQVDFSNRTQQFQRFSDFSLLPLVGGFVVDIWGAPLARPAAERERVEHVGGCGDRRPGAGNSLHHADQRGRPREDLYPSRLSRAPRRSWIRQRPLCRRSVELDTPGRLIRLDASPSPTRVAKPPPRRRLTGHRKKTGKKEGLSPPP